MIISYQKYSNKYVGESGRNFETRRNVCKLAIECILTNTSKPSKLFNTVIMHGKR